MADITALDEARIGSTLLRMRQKIITQLVNSSNRHNEFSGALLKFNQAISVRVRRI